MNNWSQCFYWIYWFCEIYRVENKFVSLHYLTGLLQINLSNNTFGIALISVSDHKSSLVVTSGCRTFHSDKSVSIVGK